MALNKDVWRKHVFDSWFPNHNKEYKPHKLKKMKIEIKKLNNAEFQRALNEFQNNVTPATMPSKIYVNPDDLKTYVNRHNSKPKNKFNNYIPEVGTWGKLKFEFKIYNVPVIPDKTVSENCIIFEK